VLEILKKAGIQNILKIFTDETEVMRTSQELTGQAPAPVQAAAPQPLQQEPQSEFDQLRSEIGSAFEPKMVPPQTRGTGAPAAGPFGEQAFPPMQPGMAQRGPFAAAPQQQQFAPPPAGPAPRYAPPPRPAPAGPAAGLSTTGGETRRMPTVTPEASIPIRPLGQPEDELDKFEATLERKSSPVEKPKSNRFADEFDEGPKKRSLTPVFVILLLLVILGGGGYYAYVNYFQGKVKLPGITLPGSGTSEKKEVPMPQLPTDNQQAPAVATPAATPSSQPTTTAPSAATTQPSSAAAVPETPAPAAAVAKPKLAPAPAPIAAKPTPAKKKVEPTTPVVHPKVAAKPRTPKPAQAASSTEELPPISTPVEAPSPRF
jgi:cytoskeletal protein RodZ